MSSIPSKSVQQVALSKKEAESSDVARDLVRILAQVLEDGLISESEIESLKQWLDRASRISDLPGICFLREEIECVLADGVIDETESNQLINSILRVLPANEREPLKEIVRQASASRQTSRKAERERIRNLPTEAQISLIKSMGGTVSGSMTKDEASQLIDMLMNRPSERQVAYLKSLGGNLPADATKSEASDLIDKLVTNRPTVRQLMVLRFWNEIGRGKGGVESVSQWMDQFYLEDPDRLLAWMQWKAETQDAYSRDFASVEQVPVGIGYQYLARVKNRTGSARTAKTSARSSSAGRIFFWLVSGMVIICLVALFVWMVVKNR